MIVYITLIILAVLGMALWYFRDTVFELGLIHLGAEPHQTVIILIAIIVVIILTSSVLWAIQQLL